MAKLELRQYQPTWDAAKPVSERDIQEDFEGGIPGWEVRMDREAWYLLHKPCSTFSVQSVHATPRHLVDLMKTHNEACEALNEKKD